MSYPFLLLLGPPRLTNRLLCRWIGRCPAPAAWVKLTAIDNEPEIFLSDVAAALESTARNVDGGSMVGILDAGDEIVDVINRLAGVGDDLLLLFTGYDVIRAQAVHEMVSLLVDYPLPAVHLVLTASREPPLPLPVWRVRRRVAVVRLPPINRRQSDNSFATRKT